MTGRAVSGLAVATLLTISIVPGVESQFAVDSWGGPFPETCDGGNATTLGDGVEDGTGNFYQFYQNPLTNHVFLTYALRAVSLSNGVDRYMAGLQMWYDHGGDALHYEEGVNDQYPHTWAWDNRRIECMDLGVWDEFSFWLVGGAIGWQSTTTVELSIWIEVEIGLEFTLGTLTEVKASGRMGGEITVSEGTTVDTDIVLDDRGGRHCSLTEPADCIPQ